MVVKLVAASAALMVARSVDLMVDYSVEQLVGAMVEQMVVKLEMPMAELKVAYWVDWKAAHLVAETAE